MEYDIAESACVVLFGLRFLSAEPVDVTADARALAAAKYKLSALAGRRYPPAAELPYYLLIGTRLHRVGYDGSCERSSSLADLRKAIAATTKALLKAGFTEAPALWAQCKYDGGRVP